MSIHIFYRLLRKYIHNIHICIYIYILLLGYDIYCKLMHVLREKKMSFKQNIDI